MRHLTPLALAAFLLCAGCECNESPHAKTETMETPAAAAKPVETYPLDAKGYIRNWLVLAPINFGAGYVADDIDKNQVPNEANLAPKEGDKQTVKSEEGTPPKMVDKEFTWVKVTPADYFIDFNAVAKLDSSTGTGAYAVAYLNAPEEIKGVTLSLSTNDDGKIFLNGKKVWSLVVGRQLAEDSDTVADQTLNKGVNVLVFKVWNDSNAWQACLRLLDKGGQPLKNVRVQLQK